VKALIFSAALISFLQFGCGHYRHKHGCGECCHSKKERSCCEKSSNNDDSCEVKDGDKGDKKEESKKNTK